MQSFNLPLSQCLDLSVNTDGHAYFKTWDGRSDFHLTPSEFAALFELLHDNGEKIAEEIKSLEGAKHE